MFARRPLADIYEIASNSSARATWKGYYPDNVSESFSCSNMARHSSVPHTMCGMENILFRAMLLLTVLAGSCDALADNAWAPLQFLVGDWKRGGRAEDAAGTGTTTFA